MDLVKAQLVYKQTWNCMLFWAHWVQLLEERSGLVLDAVISEIDDSVIFRERLDPEPFKQIDSLCRIPNSEPTLKGSFFRVIFQFFFSINPPLISHPSKLPQGNPVINSLCVFGLNHLIMPLNMFHAIHCLFQRRLVLFDFGKNVHISPYCKHQPHILLKCFSVYCS